MTDHIFTVTVLKVHQPRASRVWGYETSFEEAERKVLENYSDLFEFYFEYAVIERVEVGIPAWGDEETRIQGWYKAEYPGDGAEKKTLVQRCKCPEGYENSEGFSMG